MSSWSHLFAYLIIILYSNATFVCSRYPDIRTHRDHLRDLTGMQRARRDLREIVIHEIERQATEAWCPPDGRTAVAARDLMVAEIEDID